MGCKQITGSFGNVVALEVRGGATRTVEEGDTLTLNAVALDAAGDTATDATVTWAVLDTGQVGFTLDGATGLVTGVSPDTGSVQALVGTLRSDAIRMIVSPMPDTVSAVGTPRIEVAASSLASGGLNTLVEDLTTTPGTPRPLGGKTVNYALVDPAPGSATAAGILLTTLETPGDTLPGSDPGHRAAVTALNGQATMIVRKIAGQALPDSAIIEATAVTARGAAVPGSPVQFIVVFLAN